VGRPAGGGRRRSSRSKVTSRRRARSSMHGAGPVVLVGHSYGSAAITEAGQPSPRREVPRQRNDSHGPRSKRQPCFRSHNRYRSSSVRTSALRRENIPNWTGHPLPARGLLQQPSARQTRSHAVRQVPGIGPSRTPSSPARRSPHPTRSLVEGAESWPVTYLLSTTPSRARW
jgi:hypothetical protein